MAADYYQKRKRMALRTVEAVEDFVDALYTLLELKDERSKFAEDFQDGDFVEDINLRHLSAATIGTFFDFVVPSLKDNFDDAGNGERNKQILLQVKK